MSINLKKQADGSLKIDASSALMTNIYTFGAAFYINLTCLAKTTALSELQRTASNGSGRCIPSIARVAGWWGSRAR